MLLLSFPPSLSLSVSLCRPRLCAPRCPPPFPSVRTRYKNVSEVYPPRVPWVLARVVPALALSRPQRSRCIPRAASMTTRHWARTRRSDLSALGQEKNGKSRRKSACLSLLVSLTMRPEENERGGRTVSPDPLEQVPELLPRAQHLHPRRRRPRPRRHDIMTTTMTMKSLLALMIPRPLLRVDIGDG